MPKLAPLETAEGVEPYKDQAEFLEALQCVLEKDYHVTVLGEELKEAGRNINQFLHMFL